MVADSQRVPLLQTRNLSKRFGAVQALKNISLEVYAGEVVGLVGDNGAGKSTLIKCISGIFPIDSGEIWFDGQAVTFRSPRDASQRGIQTVYQDLALCDNLDVVGNMFLGREQVLPALVHPVKPLDETGMEKRSIQILQGLAVSLPSVRARIASLSGGQRQAVAIARAAMSDSKLVILDEPTAALGMVQTRQVLELIRRLRRDGLAILVTNHNLNEIFEIADRIVVLRLGRTNGAYEIARTPREQILAAITGTELGARVAV